MAAAVAAAVLIAVAAAVLRIRNHRRERYAAIFGSLAVAASFSLATASGVPDVDAVERVHFVEYGVITLLFYRAWRSAGDLRVVALPVAAGLIVGTLEEWFQWFIPNRVGEARDVFLNLVAIGCGLAFALAADVPQRFTWRLRPGSATVIGCSAAWAGVVFALFLDAVHLGHEVPIGNLGRFRSRYTAGELERLSRERAVAWRTRPPVALVRLSREDHYMDEGLWHIRRRNDTWAAADYRSSWNENRILEAFFAPVLDTPSYATPHASRWPVQQREDAAEKQGAADADWVSRAEPYPILLWPRVLFWPVALAAVAGVAVAGVFFDRRQRAAAPPLSV
jgi:VanZ family protein